MKKAERVRQLIDQGRLKIVDALPKPPEWLVNEVGGELAELLEVARAGNLVVVHGRVVYKRGAYMQEEADLREYASYILSSQSFLTAVHGGGHITESEYQRGIAALNAFDPAPRDIQEHELTRCYLVDDLALTYLQDAGVLENLAKGIIELRIHPSTKEDKDGLRAAGAEGDLLAERLDHVREVLRDLISTGKVRFFPASSRQERLGTSLIEIFKDVGGCDALCVDDRFVNRFVNFSDDQGKTRPIYCTLDVLDHLVRAGVIGDARRTAIEHQLRAGGLALIGISEAELIRLVQSARIDESGELVESAELRNLRRYLARIRGIELVQEPGELPFLGMLQAASIRAIRALWGDPSTPEERAVAAGRWIWKFVTPSPIDWLVRLRSIANKEQADIALAAHVKLLSTPMLQVNAQRSDAFARWIDHEVLGPLRSVNANVVTCLADMVKNEVGEVDRHFRDPGHAEG